MAPLYKPPINNARTEIPYLAMVNAADPDFQRRKHYEVEYPSPSGARSFLADPYVRGSYNDHSNTYAVGQPFGANDPLVTAAKAPTVGNTTPGLYSGTPTASWA